MTKVSTTYAKQLSAILGIDLGGFHVAHLVQLLQRRITTLNLPGEEAYLTFLTDNSSEQEQLKKNIYNHHSAFFRNPLTFAVLENLGVKILLKNSQAKVSKNSPLRIWSAGCAAGQEAYSLAIVLAEYQQLTQHPFSYRILGTDVHQTLLNQAKNGCYDARSMQHVSLGRVHQWFIRKGDQYVVSEILKEHVSFSYYDLYHDATPSPPESIFGDFDLIFCANLLLYYTQEGIEKILDRLAQNLVDGGILITGEVERETVMMHRYKELYPYSSIFQRPKELIKI